MDTNIIFTYIQSYGYFIIFLFLFFGIVGIPAPEESLLFFLGVLVAQQQLLWAYCFIVSWFGATIGMLTAYGIGFFFGHPFIKKYGKYVGIRDEKWERANQLFQKYGKWGILFGYYVPGVRQISPYMAGVTKFPFGSFLLLACVGALLWIVPIILVGIFLGGHFHFPLFYIPLIGVAFFLLFLIVVWLKQLFSKKQFEN